MVLLLAAPLLATALAAPIKAPPYAASMVSWCLATTSPRPRAHFSTSNAPPVFHVSSSSASHDDQPALTATRVKKQPDLGARVRVRANRASENPASADLFFKTPFNCAIKSALEAQKESPKAL